MPPQATTKENDMNMKRVNTLTLIGSALNWAVHQVQGALVSQVPDYSNVYAAGGPLMAQCIEEFHKESETLVWAESATHSAAGPTLLVAAMRCYLATARGLEVDVPEELLEAGETIVVPLSSVSFATDMQLLDELRGRGLVLVSWSIGDLSFLDREDWMASLTATQRVLVKAHALEEVSRSLEDIVVQRGNEHLSDWCSTNQDLIRVESEDLLRAPVGGQYTLAVDLGIRLSGTQYAQLKDDLTVALQSACVAGSFVLSNQDSTIATFYREAETDLPCIRRNHADLLKEDLFKAAMHELAGELGDVKLPNPHVQRIIDILRGSVGATPAVVNGEVLTAELQAYQDKVAAMANIDDATRFDYMLLGRLQRDCEYYLGHGNRAKKHLWAGEEAEQIAKMKELFNGFKVKPEWITLEKIEQYEAAMT